MQSSLFLFGDQTELLASTFCQIQNKLLLMLSFQVLFSQFEFSSSSTIGFFLLRFKFDQAKLRVLFSVPGSGKKLREASFTFRSVKPQLYCVESLQKYSDVGIEISHIKNISILLGIYL